MVEEVLWLVVAAKAELEIALGKVDFLFVTPEHPVTWHFRLS